MSTLFALLLVFYKLGIWLLGLLWLNPSTLNDMLGGNCYYPAIWGFCSFFGFRLLLVFFCDLDFCGPTKLDGDLLGPDFLPGTREKTAACGYLMILTKSARSLPCECDDRWLDRMVSANGPTAPGESSPPWLYLSYTVSKSASPIGLVSNELAWSRPWPLPPIKGLWLLSLYTDLCHGETWPPKPPRLRLFVRGGLYWPCSSS